MKNKIEYAGTCFQGLVRQNNEDNFWCGGQYLPCNNPGTDDVFKGSYNTEDSPSFAIFDGMGGEECGEVAAYLAAEGFDQLQSQWGSVPDSERENFLQSLCRDLNNRVCGYANEHRVDTMGSTAVLLLFNKQSFYAVNVGDSRIYRLHDHKLSQISEDHVSDSWFFRQPLLTQFLGLPEEEALLSPCIRNMKVCVGDKFLLCSDGLTKMFTDGELEEIMDRDVPVEETVSYLHKETLKRGAWDNTTILFCWVEN